LGGGNGGDALHEAFARCPEGDWLQRLLRVDGETQLPDDLLVLTDKMTMAASLECRVPLLDEELVDLAARMPSDMKIRSRRKKYILTQAMRGLLPDDILTRGKRGFGAPLGAWLREDWAPLTNRLLSPAAVARRGLLDPNTVTGVAALHTSGREDQTDQLLALISLELWCRIYLDRRTPDDVMTEVAAEMPT
jgi:asparagine synthase (glutamine-hydrolysing)